MSGKPIEIMEIRQIINLKKDGISNRKIAPMLGINRNTVNDYIKILEALHHSYDELLILDDESLKQLIAPKSEKSQARYERLSAKFPYYQKELKKPGCTLYQLWLEYKDQHPETYQYTQFTHYYRQWSKNFNVSYKLTHKAGEKAYIDYTGKHLYYVDRESGNMTPVEVYACILPCSQYTYCEASESQSKVDFIGSTNNCLVFFEGVPMALIPDNLKSAVTRGSKYEAEINKTFKDFGLHYNCVIDPARPSRPKDKALVENAVKLIYQHIFYPLSKMTFFSIKEINEAIRPLLIKLNDRMLSQVNYSRKELFLSVEKPYLRPLPPEPYEIKYYKRAKVQKMGCVLLFEDAHYYSVPYRYVGKYVELRYDGSNVEIYYNHQRLWSHKRSYVRGAYTIVNEHRTESHQEYSNWSPDFFSKKASKIGPKTAEYVSNLIAQYDYPDKGYKQSMGIIHLTRSYDAERIEKACQRGLLGTRYGYRIIENILKTGTDQLEDTEEEQKSHISPHEHLRDPKSFK